MGGNHEEILRFGVQVPVYGIDESTSWSPARLRLADRAGPRPPRWLSSESPAAVRNHRGLQASGFLSSWSRVRGQLFTGRQPACFEQIQPVDCAQRQSSRTACPRGGLPIFYLWTNRAVALWLWQAAKSRTTDRERSSWRTPSAQVAGSRTDPKIVPSRREDPVYDEAHRRRIASGSRTCSPSGISRSRKGSPFGTALGSANRVDRDTAQRAGHLSDQIKSLWQSSRCDVPASTVACAFSTHAWSDADRRLHHTVFGFSSYVPVNDDLHLDRSPKPQVTANITARRLDAIVPIAGGTESWPFMGGTVARAASNGNVTHRSTAAAGIMDEHVDITTCETAAYRACPIRRRSRTGR